jgi:hypothetical protein
MNHVLDSFALELQGTLAGRLMSADFGMARAELVKDDLGGSTFGKKQIERVVMPTLSFTCGAGMSGAFYEWLKSWLAGNFTRKDVAVIAFNLKNEITARLEIPSLISEVMFPGLDSADKGIARFGVKLAPERSRLILPKSADASLGTIKLGVHANPALRPWFVNDFRLSITALESACSRVTHIDSFGVNYKIKSNLEGSRRPSDLLPTGSEESNFAVTLPIAQATEFMDWFNNSVKEDVKDSAKKGLLEFLAPASKTAYFRVELKNLGPAQMTKPVGTGNTMTAAMYFENLDFAYAASATAG